MKTISSKYFINKNSNKFLPIPHIYIYNSYRLIFMFLIPLLFLFSCSKDENDEQKIKDNTITSFKIGSRSGVIIGKSIKVNVPSGTDISNLKAVVKISDKSSINPDPTKEIDYTNSVDFTVTAEDGTEDTYTVKVVVDSEKSSDSSDASDDSDDSDDSEESDNLGFMHDGVFNYSINLKSPNSDAKKLGEKMLIDIVFESGLGRRVHYISVKIYDKLNPKKKLFNSPSNRHIHTGSPYNFKREINLSKEDGFYAGDWVLEAKVWAKGSQRASKKVNFVIE